MRSRDGHVCALFSGRCAQPAGPSATDASGPRGYGFSDEPSAQSQRALAAARPGATQRRQMSRANRSPGAKRSPRPCKVPPAPPQGTRSSRSSSGCARGPVRRWKETRQRASATRRIACRARQSQGRHGRSADARWPPCSRLRRDESRAATSAARAWHRICRPGHPRRRCAPGRRHRKANAVIALAIRTRSSADRRFEGSSIIGAGPGCRIVAEVCAVPRKPAQRAGTSQQPPRSIGHMWRARNAGQPLHAPNHAEGAQHRFGLIILSVGKEPTWIVSPRHHRSARDGPSRAGGLKIAGAVPLLSAVCQRVAPTRGTASATMGGPRRRPRGASRDDRHDPEPTRP